MNKRTQLKSKALLTLSLNNLKELKERCNNKSGIYCLVNNINGNIYIGSGLNLFNRLLDYSQPGYLKTKSNLLIVKAILKYGIENFTILILEFTDS